MSTPCENCGSDFRVCIDCDLYNGKYIEIPDNATNETVMKTIFPNMRIEKHHSFARFVYGEEYIPCSYSWLNATYKGDK